MDLVDACDDTVQDLVGQLILRPLGTGAERRDVVVEDLLAHGVGRVIIDDVRVADLHETDHTLRALQHAGGLQILAGFQVREITAKHRLVLRGHGRSHQQQEQGRPPCHHNPC